MNYPVVLKQQTNDQELMLELDISPELSAFEGHFESFPIVPGVVQIQWALHFFKTYFLKTKFSTPIAAPEAFEVDKITALKFQHVMTPNCTSYLYLSYDHNKQNISFTISNDQHRFSSGKIKIRVTQ